MEKTRQPTETIFGDYHDQYSPNQSESHDRNGGRCQSVRPVVRRSQMANASLATVAAPDGGSRSEFAPQGEAAWDDELDVGKSASHSSRSHATGIVLQPARSRNGGDRAILHVRREYNETNPICIQRVHTAERIRTRLLVLP